jgi:acetolactate decarboxylase
MRALNVLALCYLLISCLDATAQQPANDVQIIGAMKNVMRKGQLYGNIKLDTIQPKEHLYGLGPVEYLTGEILILDGQSYRSTVVNDQQMKVSTSFDLKAPFFAYAHIPAWVEQTLPDSVQTLQQLQEYLNLITKNIRRPFMFKLSGKVADAMIHVVNLPKGSKVSSPEQAHRGRKTFQLKNEPAVLLGFFSTEHQSIFTHHNTYLHIHLINATRDQMGHLDEIHFGHGSMTLFLPAE